MAEPLKPPTALLSWAHRNASWTKAEAEEWTSKVAALAALLRQNGVDLDVDLWHQTDTSVDWTRWGQSRIEECDFTIVAVSEGWKERWEGKNAPTEGAGVVAEADALRGSFIENQKEFQRRTLLVILPGSTERDIPRDLRRLLHFRVDSLDNEGITDLLHAMRQLPLYPTPPLGTLPTAPLNTPASFLDLPALRAAASQDSFDPSAAERATSNGGKDDRAATARGTLRGLGQRPNPPSAGEHREGAEIEDWDAWSEFVTSSECITSAPGVAFLAGEYVVLEGAAAVCICVPQRVFVGVEVTGRGAPSKKHGPTIDLGSRLDHLAYDPSARRWVELSWPMEHEAHSGAALLRSNLQKLASSLNLSGTSLKIRSRHLLRPSVGPNWSGAFSAALAAALYVVADELPARVVEDWASQPVALSIESDGPFDRCHRAAWRLENAFHGGKSSGYGTFCSLIGSREPIIYMTAKRDRGTLLSESTGTFPVDLDGRDATIAQLPYTGARISELIDIDKSNALDTFPGFGIAIVYTGVAKNTGQAIDQVYHRLSEDVEKTSLNSARFLTSDILTENIRTAKLSELTVEGDVRNAHMKALTAETLVVFDAVRRLYGQHSQNNELRLIEQLASGVRRVQGSLTQLGLDWPQFYAVAAEVYKCAAEHGVFTKTGVKLTGGGQGGSVLCVVPVGMGTGTEARSDFLTNLDNSLASLELVNASDQGKPQVQVIWRSWHDAPDDVGLRVERENGFGELLGLPASVRYAYSSTAVELVEAETLGERVIIKARTNEIFGPTDVKQLRAEVTVSSNPWDMFIAFDPSDTADVYVRGHRIELPSWQDRWDRERHILAMAIAALSDQLSASQSLIRAIFDDIYPGSGGSREWTKRALLTRMVEPFNGIVRGLVFPSHLPDRERVVPTVAISGDDKASTSSSSDYLVVIRGLGAGSLRIAVADSLIIKSLLSRVAGIWNTRS
jgi:mevalonate kinase